MILQHICLVMTLAIALLDLPKWAVAVAMVPAVMLLAHCAVRFMGKE